MLMISVRILLSYECLRVVSNLVSRLSSSVRLVVFVVMIREIVFL